MVRAPFRHWLWGRLLIVLLAPFEVVMQTTLGASKGFCDGLSSVRDGWLERR